MILPQGRNELVEVGYDVMPAHAEQVAGLRGGHLPLGGGADRETDDQRLLQRRAVQGAEQSVDGDLERGRAHDLEAHHRLDVRPRRPRQDDLAHRRKGGQLAPPEASAKLAAGRPASASRSTTAMPKPAPLGKQRHAAVELDQGEAMVGGGDLERFHGGALEPRREKLVPVAMAEAGVVVEHELGVERGDGRSPGRQAD